MLALIQRFDTNTLHLIQSAGPWWHGIAWSLSAVVSFSAVVIVCVAAFLCMRGRGRAALGLSIAYVLSLAVTQALKYAIGAPRPFEVDPSVIRYAFEASSGMPSGHALTSFVVFGWIWIKGRKSWGAKSRLISVALWSFVFLVGLSRVYLGVHYPSQVFAGWGIGALLLGVLWQIDAKFFSGRNR
jgi:undecaprenyl-diphosphatase